jgi:hypothetical protein
VQLPKPASDLDLPVTGNDTHVFEQQHPVPTDIFDDSLKMILKTRFG